MRRVVRVVKGDGASHVDSVILAPEQRRLQTARLTGVNGTAIGLMLMEPVLVRMGDALELDDGSLVEIVVEPEKLTEIRGADVTHLARLAWHLGDRHVPIQVLASRIRMRRDPGLETMLAALGARLTPIEAPFDPEGGAYATQAAPDGHVHDAHCGHDHAHGHDRHRGHDHHHHHHQGHGRHRDEG